MYLNNRHQQISQLTYLKKPFPVQDTQEMYLLQFLRWMKHVMLYYMLIGASLSKPHTSVTALRTRVYVYLWTDHLPEILN